MVKKLVLADTVTGEFDGVVKDTLNSTFGVPIVVRPGGDIQAAIDLAASTLVGSSMAVSRPVVIYGGVYNITSQIVHPPYVKVIAAGPVVFRTNVPGNSAWWLAPLASDPTSMSPDVGKAAWNSGKPLDGSNGPFIFVNKTGSRTGTIGIETGPRSDTGALRPMARYEIEGLWFQEYGTAWKWNAFRQYIATYKSIWIELCDTLVRYGAGGPVIVKRAPLAQEFRREDHLG